jgi:signal transduction histidine kinase
MLHAQEAEVDLLLSDRTSSGLLRRDIQERLAARLSDARGLAVTVEERRIVTEAQSRVAAYIAKSRDSGITAQELEAYQEAAYGALEALVQASVASAREAHRVASSLDQRANYIGLGAGTLLLVMAAWLLIWLERRAFAPILELMNALERFGKGDNQARAPESGPAELRKIAWRFNEMASALAVRRQAQIAFLGGVAHDLRNPLSVLKMSVALMPPNKPLPPEPRIRNIVEKVDRQITRLDRMAGDFLGIAKIEAGELELKIDAHDARDLIRAVVHLFEGTFPEPRLVLTLPSEPIEVHCDQLRIEQVLTNLISNALKYSPRGSPVEVAVEASGERVTFRVADRGIGIPESEQALVFEPFRRSGLWKETVPGIGLGLFVVRNIVEAHGGSIQLQSAPGVGSTFSVNLLRFCVVQHASDGKRARAG